MLIMMHLNYIHGEQMEIHIKTSIMKILMVKLSYSHLIALKM